MSQHVIRASRSHRRRIGQNAAGPTTQFYDTFTDANGTLLTAHTPDIDVVGGGWAKNGGAIQIFGNQADPSGDGVAWAWVLSSADCGVSDCTLRCDIYGGYAISAEVEGLRARYTNNSNFWAIGLDRSGSLFKIAEINAGVSTVRASAAFVPGYPHALEAILSGTTITAHMDGGNEISYAAAVLNSGATRHGISFRSSLSPSTIDEFEVVA